MAVESDGKTEEEIPNDLFKDVTYYIVGNISDEVISLLSKGGAKRDTYLSQMVSHVISDETQSDDYSEARELFELPVVTSAWVQLSVKCRKQLPKENFALEGHVFSGVVVCPSKLEVEDANALWGMITYNGGRCQLTLDNTCTHLITAATEGEKYENASKREDKIKIVTPDWITDSITNGAKQDEITYHPTLLVYPKPEPTSPAKNFETEQMETDSADYLQIPITERRPSSEDGGRNGSRPDTPSAKEALARMVSNRLQANARSDHRGSNGHSPKSRSPGTPPYAQTGPHLQVPPPVYPMMQHMESQQQRTLRNITNSADMPRSPVRPNADKISQMLGLTGQSQRPMTGSPSQPPAPSTFSYWGHDPTDNVPPDMCLLGCVFYITDYQKLVGPSQISNWKLIIEQNGGQVDPSYSNRVTHLLCSSQHTDVLQLALKDQRRVVTAYWLNDTLVQKKMLPPWQALHLPLIYKEDKPCSNQIICVTNFDGEERARVKQMIMTIGAKYTGYMTHSNSVLVCKRPGGLKYEKAKEWRIPVVNTQWLTDLVLGNLQALRLPVQNQYLTISQGSDFQLDPSKVPHLMGGWRTPLKIAKELWKRFVPTQKLKQPHAPGQENVGLPDFNEPPAKRQRIENGNGMLENAPKVLFTGFSRGTVKKLQMIVETLGGVVVDNPRYCTHLVSQSLSRTMKFFIAINIARFIVTKEWLEDCYTSGRFVDEEKYILKDTSAEMELNCNLPQSLNRARTRPLFQGLMFHITPSVLPSPSDLTKIVESAGGTVVKRRLAPKTILGKKDEKGNPSYIIITCPNDIHICRDLVNKRISVHNAEFILTGVMRQEVDYKLYKIDVH